MENNAIIMRIVGGFASQVNKYLWGCLLAEYTHKQLILDLTDYAEGYFRPFALDYVNLPEQHAVKHRFWLKKLDQTQVIRNGEQLEKVLVDKNRRTFYICCEEVDCMDFFAHHPDLQVTVDTRMLQNFDLKQTSEFVNSFIRMIDGHECVAVHVRRGDFTTLGWADDTSYYRAAIAYFLSKNPDMQFFFFSNDLDWVRQQYGSHSCFHYVSALKGTLGDVEEFFCMSLCKYRILSKFSGFGILANIVSAIRDVGEYAVVDGSTILSEEARDTAQLYQKHKKLVEANKIGEIVERSRGGVIYLLPEQICKYQESYEELLLRADSRGQIATFEELDKRCDRRQELLEEQATAYLKHVDKEQARECLEVLESLHVYLPQMWNRIYQLDAIFEQQTYVVLSLEPFDRWKQNGMYLFALTLGRLGKKVYYINLFDFDYEGNGTVVEEKFRDSTNMDGTVLPLLEYTEGHGCISQLLDAIPEAAYDLISDYVPEYRPKKAEKIWILHKKEQQPDYSVRQLLRAYKHSITRADGKLGALLLNALTAGRVREGVTIDG